MTLERLDQPLPPLRGLVPMHNAKGRPYGTLDLKRWVRLNRLAYGCVKVDALAHGTVPLEPFEALLAYAESIDARLSLRNDASAPPPDLAALKKQGLWDVFVCPASLDAPQAVAWFEAAAAADLPLRVQLTAPFPPDLDAGQWAGRVAGAVSVNLALSDPFQPGPPACAADEGRATVRAIEALAGALIEHGADVSIVGVPFCLLPEDLWPHGVNSPQFFRDPAHYRHPAYDIAQKLYRRSPVVAGKALLSLLMTHTVSRRNLVDNALLPWMLHHPWVHARVWAWHKLTRHIRWLQQLPRERAATAGAGPKPRPAHTAECARCALQAICDGPTDAVRRRLPGLAITAQTGERVAAPLHFALTRPRYLDAADRDRLASSTLVEALAQTARDRVNTETPTREIDSDAYFIQGQYTESMPNSVRWYAFTPGEKTSSPLATLEAPSTLSVTFGGGFAEAIGFAFGTHGRVMCHMEAQSHLLVLHIEADGRYVLLRDDKPVRPLDFESRYYAPLRLGTRFEPRIAIWNIDGAIVTQTVQLWEGGPGARPEPEPAQFSVVIVSSRFARRLQAVLRAIGHQPGLTPGQVEVIVAYVPGLDAVDDLLDSAAAVYPHIRFIRTPFPEHLAHSKGFMINESVRLATGEWVVLLDSDVLLPPGWFEALGRVDDSRMFAVPDGRKMLTPETTAQILMGEIAPWEAWDDLLKSAGEYRHKEALGVPPGFCQCVRRACFDAVRYHEHEHFEGADWWFAKEVRETFGPECRLSGRPVLHLDHGGSQWYGTAKHR